MCLLEENWLSGSEKITDRNPPSPYLPVRNKGNDFDWDNVVALVLACVLKKKLNECTYDQLKNNCETYFRNKLDDPDFWKILEKMYFDGNALYKVSPEFLLLKAQESESNKISTGDKRISSILSEFLGENFLPEEPKSNLNFIEKNLLNVFKEHLVPSVSKYNNEPYLPFLSESFTKDFQFLTYHSNYMLSEIKDFLAFYCFSYCAQLSLNIREWRNGYPKPKPLYFILDNEKASNERDAIKNHGFKSFNDSLFFLFPILSMLENLQPKGNKRYPLWKIYKKISDSDNKKLISLNLKKYTISFAEARNIVIDFDKLTSIDDCLIELMRIATEQFRDNNTTRGDINEKYCRELLQFFGSGFVHNRKRAGRVLVLNKDTVLLLTNLSIGSEERLRFNELIKEFESRGVFVDKYTEQELIRFYERVGNVERMSDSGDAVYVRKTI